MLYDLFDQFESSLSGHDAADSKWRKKVSNLTNRLSVRMEKNLIERVNNHECDPGMGLIFVR